MWIRDRTEALDRCTTTPWDVVIVGGGVTGAAVLREAAHAGLRALLVERGDFASGTSSRSSKLVHGGFRYLGQGRLRLVKEAARERQRLLREAQGLVTPVGFSFAAYRGDGTRLGVMRAATMCYGLLARGSQIEELSSAQVRALCPGLRVDGLRRGFRAVEGQTDDARLVLRLIADAVAAGAGALNYVGAEGVAVRRAGGVEIAIRDGVSGRMLEVGARAAVLATGASVDGLREGRRTLPLRRLRGSHLVFPATRFPLLEVIAFRHPDDGRYVSAAPWEGAVILGTTDEDHAGPSEAPAARVQEVDYLLSALHATFPGLGLTAADIGATFSGIRAVVGRPGEPPSTASREDMLVTEGPVVTVTGGKLTTFRPTARRVLEALRPALPPFAIAPPTAPAFDPAPPLPLPALDDALRRRLGGRYGGAARSLINALQPGDLEAIGETPTIWAEVLWAARAEGVVRLADLLLRRTRLGLLLPDGGRRELPRIRSAVQMELGWDDAKWESEVREYQTLWDTEHRPPPPHGRKPDAG